MFNKIEKRAKRQIAYSDKIDSLLANPSKESEYDERIREKVNKSSLCVLLEKAISLEGDIIECGVFRGSSIRLIVHVMVQNTKLDKNLYAADSFEGFPPNGVTEEDSSFFRPVSKLSRKFGNAIDVPSRLTNLFLQKEVQGHIIKGYFEKTLNELPVEKLCFFHLDSDTYSSHVFCLNLLYEKVVPGGIIVFDDYHQSKWPGATKAIDEFFSDKPETPVLCDKRENPAWYIEKR